MDLLMVAASTAPEVEEVVVVHPEGLMTMFLEQVEDLEVQAALQRSVSL
jgi:hypothetical protein